MNATGYKKETDGSSVSLFLLGMLSYTPTTVMPLSSAVAVREVMGFT